jgi:hypothetical protein
MFRLCAYMFLLMVGAVNSGVRAQDLTSLLEEAPTVAAAVAKALEKAPSFSGRVGVEVASRVERGSVSKATGTVESQSGRIRWLVKLGDIHSPHLTAHARSAVRQINGEQVLLLTRPDKAANYLVLSGCEAYLEQALPGVKLLSTTKGTAAKETLEGRVCTRESFTGKTSEGQSLNLIVWRATDLKNLPVQLQVTVGDSVFRVRFSEVRIRPVPAGVFHLPGGLSRYETVEDLVQSVLVTKMKRRMGLE